MNAAGLVFILKGVSAVLGMPDFKALVTDGSVSQDEFDGTRHNLSSIIATLQNTPSEKTEAMVAKYDEELTAHNDKFNTKTHEQALNSFRNAQIMMGYVTMVMAKSGVRG